MINKCPPSVIRMKVDIVSFGVYESHAKRIHFAVFEHALDWYIKVKSVSRNVSFLLAMD